MVKNGLKKGVTIDLKEKEGFEQLRMKASTDTVHIKAEFRTSREGVKY